MYILQIFIQNILANNNLSLKKKQKNKKYVMNLSLDFFLFRKFEGKKPSIKLL